MRTRVKYLRRQRAMTQLELANLAGISNQTIVNIEKYGKEPTVGTIRKLAKAFNIETSELFTDDPSQSDGEEERLARIA